jgi:DegV family protein with EDD domain
VGTPIRYRAVMPAPVAVVTDSTASLPPHLGARLTVVPLTVVVSGVQRREGVDIAGDEVVRALTARRTAITTSRPSPEQFIQVYRQLLRAGAPAVVSVHLSTALSGTYEAAQLAATEFADRVAVLDSHSTGMGLGFPALAAAEAAVAGGDISAVLAAASAAVGRTTALFYVDTLEFLRRGGRIGAAAALLGTALSVKPILHMAESGIVVKEKVRTASRALARLIDLAVDAAGESTVDVAIHHLAAAERAEAVADEVKDRLRVRLRAAYLTEVGPVIGTHVGPGMVAAVVCRLPAAGDTTADG